MPTINLSVHRRQHPEFEKHRTHGERAEAYRLAVEAWRESGAPLPGRDDRTWTVERARELLDALIDLFGAYNRVLWRRFPYCGQCLGGCCVVDAADLKAVDYVALALLEEELPERPARSPVSEAACIYLTPRGCSWPAAWRPFKCAAFYCLGSGDWRLDAADARYEEITEELQRVVRERLPAIGRHVTLDEKELLDLLPDPVAFAGALAECLDETLVAALRTRYPVLVPEEATGTREAGDPTADALTFIAEAVEALHDAPPAPDGLSADQLLADLETLEWVLRGRPARGEALLAEMAERYAVARPPAEGEAPSIWYRMQRHLHQLTKAT